VLKTRLRRSSDRAFQFSGAHGSSRAGSCCRVSTAGGSESSRGYGDADWLEQQFAAAELHGSAAGSSPVDGEGSKASRSGSGQAAGALMLFGEIEPHASRIRARVPLISRLQGMRYLREPFDAGATSSSRRCEAGGTAAIEACSHSFRSRRLSGDAPRYVLVSQRRGRRPGLAAGSCLCSGALGRNALMASQESEAPGRISQAMIRADGDSR